MSARLLKDVHVRDGVDDAAVLSGCCMCCMLHVHPSLDETCACAHVFFYSRWHVCLDSSIDAVTWHV